MKEDDFLRRRFGERFEEAPEGYIRPLGVEEIHYLYDPTGDVYGPLTEERRVSQPIRFDTEGFTVATLEEIFGPSEAKKVREFSERLRSWMMEQAKRIAEMTESALAMRLCPGLVREENPPQILLCLALEVDEKGYCDKHKGGRTN